MDKVNSKDNTWELKVFFDGACPLCKREISWLRKKTGEQKVCYEDISAPEFSASVYNMSYDAFMNQMQALKVDGTKLVGMEVFREVYKYTGFGWLLVPTGWPGLKQLFDYIYSIFAKYRLRMTNRHCDDTSCS